jgi:phosphatidylserine/phosphatidylglycerophosphate/cardiolipin synthase-like enzyme
MKAPGPYMHLKSYDIDDQVSRSGSANLSASGLKQQDNDLVVLHQPSAAAAFKARFVHMWAEANYLPAPSNQLAGNNSISLSRTDSSASADCRNKGNVSRRGERIYHLPADRTYDQVRMDKAHGKRWFCTEEQAVAAGWRKASTW